MSDKERLKYLIAMCLLFIMGFAALTLSACSTQPAMTPEVAEEGEIVGHDLEGFPPYIPHDLERGADCLTCHREGEIGKAPKTPHPELTTCRQCHVLERI